MHTYHKLSRKKLHPWSWKASHQLLLWQLPLLLPSLLLRPWLRLRFLPHSLSQILSLSEFLSLQFQKCSLRLFQKCFQQLFLSEPLSQSQSLLPAYLLQSCRLCNLQNHNRPCSHHSKYWSRHLWLRYRPWHHCNKQMQDRSSLHMVWYLQVLHHCQIQTCNIHLHWLPAAGHRI